jgi:hypothetical protein
MLHVSHMVCVLCCISTACVMLHASYYVLCACVLHAQYYALQIFLVGGFILGSLCCMFHAWCVLQCWLVHIACLIWHVGLYELHTLYCVQCTVQFVLCASCFIIRAFTSSVSLCNLTYIYFRVCLYM